MSQTSHSQNKAYDEEIKKRFKLEKEPLCRRIKNNEPPLPELTFYARRYYSSLDGKKTCQIIDVWIENLTTAPNDYRKDMNSVIYRFSKGKWIKESGLDNIPMMRIRDQKTGILYFITEFVEEPFFRKRIVYFSGAWNETGKHLRETGIESLGSCLNVPRFECSFINASLERIKQIEIDRLQQAPMN
jgi:hypothetical protein